MVVKHHQNRHKSIGDILLYTVITTGNISNTDLYFRPYRSGRDYCSEFGYLLYKGGLIDIATINVKFYCEIYTITLYQCNLIVVTIAQYISIILRKSQFGIACPNTLINQGFQDIF